MLFRQVLADLVSSLGSERQRAFASLAAGRAKEAYPQGIFSKDDIQGARDKLRSALEQDGHLARPQPGDLPQAFEVRLLGALLAGLGDPDYALGALLAGTGSCNKGYVGPYNKHHRLHVNVKPPNLPSKRLNLTLDVSYLRRHLQ